jgi:hypothetical protein
MGAREGASRHAEEYKWPRIIASWPGQVRRGRGHIPADAAALEGAREGALEERVGVGNENL